MKFCGVDAGCIRALPEGLFAARAGAGAAHSRLGGLRGAVEVWVLLWELFLQSCGAAARPCSSFAFAEEA